jgi:hypothetical protein
MKLLILCPGKVPKSKDNIHCFTDVINYYLPPALLKICDGDVLQIPSIDDDRLKHIFSTVQVDKYDAIITLNLRFYSKISKETTELIRSRFNGLVCQVHDGSRMDHDPVDITFTFKNDNDRLSSNTGWYARHIKYNEYMGWAADPELNFPNQDPKNLRILVDHTNYGDNEVDETPTVLQEIKRFIDSDVWREKYDSVSVRRFDSGRVVDVDLENLKVERYDRNKTISISEISKEHAAAHVFCVTHPESVGLVVLETATAGAFIISPEGFIPKDRLNTVRHSEWKGSVDWDLVLKSIDIEKSRKKAMLNSWNAMAENIVEALTKRMNNDTN